MRLLGRQRERDHLDRLIGGGQRLVTVSGRSGVGKTALLRALESSPPDRVEVWPVDVRGSATGASLLEVIAREWGVGARRSAHGAVDGIARMVGAAPVVVAVDHADDSVVDRPSMAHLFDRCPHVQVVIARAEPFDDQDDGGIALRPLAVPPASAGFIEAMETPSVQLFVDRATRADARFRMDARTTDAVVRIVRLLGGLPLAIELAAARVALMTPERLASVLADDAETALDLLVRRERDGSRSGLRAALASTWATLDGGERRLGEAVAAFGGPFPFDAALGVGAAPAGDVADRLDRLVDLHLVERDTSAPEGDEFSLSPIVRRFARSQIRGGADAIADRRRTYLAGVLERATRAVLEPAASADLDSARVLRKDLVAEAEELWASDAAAGARWAIRCARVLQAYVETPRIAAVLEQVIATGTVDTLDPADRFAVWLCSANILSFSPDGVTLSATIRDRVERGMALIDEVEDVGARLQGMLFAIQTHITTGDLAAAVTIAETARRAALAATRPVWAARFQAWTAAARHSTGDVAGACELAFEALMSAERAGDAQAIAGAAMLLHTLPPGTVAEDRPVISLEDALALTRAQRETISSWFLLAALARQALSAGRVAEAARWSAVRLAASRRRGWSYLSAISLVHTVLIACAVGDFAFAARILGAVSADRERVLRAMAPTTSAEFERVRVLLAARLGAAHAAALIAAGGSLTMPDATAEALRWLRGHQDEVVVESPPPPALTVREAEVLSLIAEGLTNKEIASSLGIAVKTVMHHTGAIYRKLGVRGRAEATAFALRNGLVELTTA
jgi:DNA-binding CsgD family transcriptional regulator/predicted ATPase